MYLSPPKTKNTSDQQIEALAVSTTEAARLLGVSERTVSKLAKEKKIACKKVGWRSLYSIASLRAYLESPDE